MAVNPANDLYLAAGVRELDRLAIEEHHIPGFTLMKRAGYAVFSALLGKWPATKHIICFCGSGNNAGDGYVVAKLAAEKGINTTIVALGNPDRLSGDARLAYDMAAKKRVDIVLYDKLDSSTLFSDSKNQGVIVDALLGTGLTGNVRGDYRDAIALINALPLPVVAADIPSGLCSDSGRILGIAVKAEMTVTFIGRKLGQTIEQGPAICGELVFDDLGVPGEIYSHVAPATP